MKIEAVFSLETLIHPGRIKHAVLNNTTASSRQDVLMDMKNVIREIGEVPPKQEITFHNYSHNVDVGQLCNTDLLEERHRDIYE